MNQSTTSPQTAAELLAFWEVAESEEANNQNWTAVRDHFRELSGGWEVDHYTTGPETLTDDNIVLRFSNPSHDWHFLVYVHTSDDPLYFIFTYNQAHRIWSHELPEVPTDKPSA